MILGASLKGGPNKSRLLLLKSKRDISTSSKIKDTLRGLEHSYFYTGERIGNSDNIELDGCTVIMDSEENIYLRSCNFRAKRHLGGSYKGSANSALERFGS